MRGTGQHLAARKVVVSGNARVHQCLLWYERSDHKIEQSDHATWQGLSQLYCLRRQFVPLWPLQRDKQATAGDRKYFITLPFSYPIKCLSVAQEKKKTTLIQCYGCFH